MEPIGVVLKSILKFIETFKSIPDEYEKAIEYLHELVTYSSISPTEIQMDGTMYMQYFKMEIMHSETSEDLKDTLESQSSEDSGCSIFKDSEATTEMKVVYLCRIVEICHSMLWYDLDADYLYNCIKAVLIRILVTSSLMALFYLKSSSIITIEHKKSIYGDLIKKVGESKAVYNSLDLNGYLKPALQEFRL